MAVKWKWKPAAGGSVPAELTQKVNQNETKINTIEGKYVKKDEANTFTVANTFNNGFTVPNSAEAYVEKDITNANDNQIVNYKGFYWKRIGQML